MISNNLSMVEALRPASEGLAAKVALFLAAGGEIFEAESFGYVPRPITYSTMMPPAPRPFTRRKAEAMPAPVVKPKRPSMSRPKKKEEATQIEWSPERVEEIRAMAETMSQFEVTAKTGISRSALFHMSKKNGFKFKPAQKISPIAEAALVLRINDCKKKGLNRNRARLLLGISSCLMTRVIMDQGIDYPVETY